MTTNPANQTGLPLTDLQRKAYLACRGTECPYCGGGDIKSDRTDGNECSGTTNTFCTTCKSEWVDIWSLTGVTEVDESSRSR